ncbi:metallophosphoesterase [Methanocaldococcus indicus]|uniref:metallophosphoesterase n=1 Tax=Methanocaldococcus indicus TaxID=213231 RepID=UPI003C6DA667
MKDYMKFGKFKLTNARCLIYKKVGIIGDLHIGFDVHFCESGAMFPMVHMERVLNDIKETIHKFKLKKLIINGDIKHNFKPYPKEIKLLDEFIKELKSEVELILIRGNHDTLCPFDLEEHYKLDDFVITHGHKYMDKEDFLILSHEHPSIRLRDELGSIIKFPIYLINNNYIVLPAFNRFSPGNDLISNYPSSKIIREDYLNSNVVAITDVGLLDFGNLKDLREFVEKCMI